MTDFEKAQIRLQAWEAIRGWGVMKKDDKGIPTNEPWNWDERLKFAERLFEWATRTPQESGDVPHE
jgi:hypothetical protein